MIFFTLNENLGAERGIGKLMETNKDAIEASFAVEVPVIFCELLWFSSSCRG
jgi:hypothetical protein